MEWPDVLTREPIYFNLGGGTHCHPRAGYENYISVDLHPLPGDWSVQHDLRLPIPLPNGSVARLHSEDFFEHITTDDSRALLAECHRLLAPGGRLRIGVPDYQNPKDRFCLALGRDPNDPKHVTLTNHRWMKDLLAASPFARHRFYHYWDGDRFVREPIDYSLGMIRRTPDNDPRCRRIGAAKIAAGALTDVGRTLLRGFRASELERSTWRGHPLHVTSLVVDLFRD
jgi:predicted SAM-dependent methyltransferase